MSNVFQLFLKEIANDEKEPHQRLETSLNQGTNVLFLVERCQNNDRRKLSIRKTDGEWARTDQGKANAIVEYLSNIFPLFPSEIANEVEEHIQRLLGT